MLLLIKVGLECHHPKILWKEVSTFSPHIPILTSSWLGKLVTDSHPYFQDPSVSSRMPPTPRYTPSPMLKPCAVDDISPFPLSTLGQEQVPSIQVTDTAHDAHSSIITSTALNFEEHLDPAKEKDRYKGDPDRLKQDLKIVETVKQSFAEAKEAAPVQQTTSLRTISMKQEYTALGLGFKELIQALPDWLLSDGNTSYDLKKYLSHEVCSVHVDIIPDSGIL